MMMGHRFGDIKGTSVVRWTTETIGFGGRSVVLFESPLLHEQNPLSVSAFGGSSFDPIQTNPPKISRVSLSPRVRVFPNTRSLPELASLSRRSGHGDRCSCSWPYPSFISSSELAFFFFSWFALFLLFCWLIQDLGSAYYLYISLWICLSSGLICGFLWVLLGFMKTGADV